MTDVVTLEPPAASVRRPPLSIEPATPVIGAEVSGIDVSKPLDPATFEELHRALLKWRDIHFI